MLIGQLSTGRVYILPPASPDGYRNAVLLQSLDIGLYGVFRRLLKLPIVYRIILDQVYLGGYSFTKFHQSPNVLRLIVDALPDHIFVNDRSFGLLVPVFQRIHQIC